MDIQKFHFQTITSTNTWAKEHLDEFNPSFLTIITAEEQTKGRGRFSRSWLSPQGNLFCTYVFFMPLSKQTGNVPQILALSAFEILKQFIPNVKIKWPNDLVKDHKKLAGILCEVVQHQDQYAIILGIGININMDFYALQLIDRPATSLKVECAKDFDVSEIANALHRHFQDSLENFLLKGFSLFLNRYKSAIIHKRGETIRFNNFTNIISGHFLEINEDGSLSMIKSDGHLMRCTSGELNDVYTS